MEGITRVFPARLGYRHYPEDTSVGGETKHFSQFGCTYDEWDHGVSPTPMEELYCPLKFCGSNLANPPCGRCRSAFFAKGWLYNFDDCMFFPDKAECWKEWHEKND